SSACVSASSPKPPDAVMPRSRRARGRWSRAAALVALVIPGSLTAQRPVISAPLARALTSGRDTAFTVWIFVRRDVAVDDAAPRGGGTAPHGRRLAPRRQRGRSGAGARGAGRGAMDRPHPAPRSLAAQRPPERDRRGDGPGGGHLPRRGRSDLRLFRDAVSP